MGYFIKSFIIIFILFSSAIFADYNFLYEDPLNLVDPIFKCPEQDKERVLFWMKVYDEWNENKVIVHDKNNLSLIYGMFDLQQFYTGNINQKQINTNISDFIDSKNAQIRAFLRGFNVSSKKPKWMPADTFRILKRASPSKLNTLASTLRSQKGLKNGFQKALTFSHPYFLDMEKIFSKKGIHPHLTRISLVESMFNPYSVSKSGATGVWQIMPAIEKAFLNRKSGVDERIDPLKSTHAAAELLKENLLLLNKKIPLAVVAYNQGVSEIKVNHKNPRFANNSYKFLRTFNSPRFKFSGQNYYYEFLAALYLQLYSDTDWKSLNTKPTLALK